MKISYVSLFSALAIGISGFDPETNVVNVAFKPNEGPECKLTCRNRVPREHCPSFHYDGGQLKSCSHTQYGCVDKDLKDCGEMATPPPLCVVTGPCHAGPTGCLEDKTGADDGLPAGEYVGHCPKAKSPEAKCDECRQACATRFPGTGPQFQVCLSQRCRSQCYGDILYKLQYSDAKVICTAQGHEFGDIAFQGCVKDTLDGTIPENYRCLMQFRDTESYCTSLGYKRGEFEFQGCIKKSFDGICSEEFRCAPQFKDARKYCIRQNPPIGGPEFQKCISSQLDEFCPKDVGCKKRHTDAREYCKTKGDFGSPEWQVCVSQMLDPSCPKDFNCGQRKSDTGKYCKQKGFSEGTGEYNECMKDGLGDICPGLSGSIKFALPKQEVLEL